MFMQVLPHGGHAVVKTHSYEEKKLTELSRAAMEFSVQLSRL